MLGLDPGYLRDAIVLDGASSIRGRRERRLDRPVLSPRWPLSDLRHPPRPKADLLSAARLRARAATAPPSLPSTRVRAPPRPPPDGLLSHVSFGISSGGLAGTTEARGPVP